MLVKQGIKEGKGQNPPLDRKYRPLLDRRSTIILRLIHHKLEQKAISHGHQGSKLNVFNIVGYQRFSIKVAGKIKTNMSVPFALRIRT